MWVRLLGHALACFVGLPLEVHAVEELRGFFEEEGVVGITRGGRGGILGGHLCFDQRA